MIEQALVHLLSSNGFRIYAAPLPQNVALPALTYQSINEKPRYNLMSEKSYRLPNFQIDAWESSKKESVVFREEIRGLIGGFSGEIQGIKILSILINRIIDMPLPEIKKWRVIFDLEISYEMMK